MMDGLPPINGYGPDGKPVCAASAPQAKPLIYDRRDRLAVFFTLGCAFLFCQFVLFGGLGFSVPLFVAVFYILLFAYLKPTVSRAMIVTFVPVALLSLCFALYDNEALRCLNAPALIALVFLNLAACTDEVSVFAANPVAGALRAFFTLPYKNMGKSAAIISKSGFSAGRWKTVGLAVIGVLIISPVALLVLFLLKDSDINFSRLVSGMFRYLSVQMFQTAVKVMLSIVLSLPLFSLFYSLRYREKSAAAKNGAWQSIQIADRAVAVAALTVVNLIYLLYISLQIGYLFSAFAHTLPTGFTYAEYARSGFFELMAVAVINLALIAGAAALTRRIDGRMPAGSRAVIGALALLTMLIIATSVSKMAMYISMYNLTPLRVYTMWFMLLLAAVFILILIKTAAPRFRFALFAAIACVAFYLALNFINPDSLVARYNIDRYLSGAAETVDVAMISQLSDSMVPQLMRLEGDSKYSAGVNAALSQKQLMLRRGTNWENLSVARLIAQNTLRDIDFKAKS